MPENIPWKTLQTDAGEVPFYIIQFDEGGECTSPAALDDLVRVTKGKTDVFLFAHGWNNDWADATARYDEFAELFVAACQKHWPNPNRTYQPVLAGVFWPSAILTAPWEHAPDIAGLDPLEADLRVLDDVLSVEDAATLRALAADPAATTDDALQAAKILAAALEPGGDDLGSEATAPPIAPADLLAVWQKAPFAEPAPEGDEGGFIADEEEARGVATAEPDEAGWNPLRWIRDGIRAFTVLQMKDRAGRVGGNGVASMLRELAKPDIRIHLIGHSYGCKVVMSALCHGDAPKHKVDSILLLEPAFSCYGFTHEIDGHPGGYRTALKRVRQPIITTRSEHDTPLRKLFHLAVRRSSDLGEAQIAGQPPSKFAALGGYGPYEVPEGVEWIDLPDDGEPYPSTANRIYAVDGTAYIAGHGAVETPQTAWALLTQVMG